MNRFIVTEKQGFSEGARVIVDTQTGVQYLLAWWMNVAGVSPLLDADGKLHLEKAGLIAYSHGLYQKLGEVIGFFGWSVAREDVFRRRMSDYR